MFFRSCYDRRVRLAIIVVVACAIARVAVAQAPVEAERLFREGLALFDEGKFTEACEKFEQSIAKDPRALGTLMNLGRCNERRGKVATALAMYQEAFDRASEANATTTRDKAQERIAALAVQVPVVTFKRAAAPLAGEKLVIDDKVVPLTKTELTLDPGAHTLVLTAPGRLPFQQTITLAVSARLAVELPALELPKERTVVKRVGGSPQRALGKIATFGGAGLVVIAGAVTLYARHDYDKQFDDPDGSGPALAHCGAFPDVDGKRTCDEVGQARTDRARNLGTAAQLIGAVGITAAAAGLVLWLTAPTDERATLVPTGSATSAGLAIAGRF
jgi:tetratricopeptide (TPR) repeat protein